MRNQNVTMRCFCAALVVFIMAAGFIMTAGRAASQQTGKEAFEIALPGGFPEEFPIYPNSEVKTVCMAFSDDFSAGMPGIQFTAQAPHEKVFSWMKNALSQKKWDILQEVDLMKTTGHVEMMVEKGDWFFQIKLAPDEENSGVTWLSLMGEFPSDQEPGKQTQLRNYLPEHVPFSEGAKLLGVMLVLTNEGKEVTLESTSNAKPFQIARPLIQEFEKAGWAIKNKMGVEGEAAHFEAGKNKESLSLDVRFEEDEDEGLRFSRCITIYHVDQ